MRRVWRISPLACIGCVAVGVTNSSFRTLSPVYAEQIGMSVTDVVTFVSIGIIGGAHHPVSARPSLGPMGPAAQVLLITTCGAMLAALALVFLAGTGPLANFGLVFIFGSFAMPLFSLSAAHANDRADKGEFVLINAALMLFYSFGAIGGPVIAASFMQRFGPQWLFIFCAAVYAVFILIILYRMQARAAVPASRRGHFTRCLRTSTIFARLTRRNGGSGKGSAEE